MGIAIKFFVFALAVCAVSALPVNDANKVNEPQIDLLAAESSPITDNQKTDELTRDKRHHRYYGGYYGGYGKNVVH